MATGRNFYYDDSALGATIGQSLGRALFGDPEMAAKKRELDAKLGYYGAQANEADAHAGVYRKQADGLGIQNDASTALPRLMRELFGQQGQPPMQPAAEPDPLAPLPESTGDYYNPQPQGFDPVKFQAGLPALFAAMGQMNGEKIDPNAIVGGLAAMIGNDEFARRGMVAQGKTPGEEFALTADRADDIAKQGYDADYRKGTDVARINHANDIPVANIRADASRYGSDRSLEGRKYSADRSLDGKVYSADAKDYDRPGAIALGNTLGTVTSTVRDKKKNTEVGGVANSFHLDTRGGRGIDIARAKGVTHAQVVQKYRNAGFTILEDLDEGDHSHLALGGGKAPGTGKGKGGAAPKPVSKPQTEAIVSDLTTAIDDEGLDITPAQLRELKQATITLFQQSGNAAAAVNTALRNYKHLRGVRDKKAAPAPKAQAKAAPKAAPPVDLRREALAAIAKGADPAAVRARYKQKTGTDL